MSIKPGPKFHTGPVNRAESRKTLPCLYCYLEFKIEVVYRHELHCHKNPNLNSRYKPFKSLGKEFIRKKERPLICEAPDLRICSLHHSDGRIYPVLQDDMFWLFENYPSRIKRIGSYRYRGMNMICFRVQTKQDEDLLTSDDVFFLDTVWACLRKAKLAGASLHA